MDLSVYVQSYVSRRYTRCFEHVFIQVTMSRSPRGSKTKTYSEPASENGHARLYASRRSTRSYITLFIM